jgi:hypothetical protein
MPEKKDQETHRHAWPPEAVTCYMPTYFVLKEQESGRDTYTLVRMADGRPGFMIRTHKYTDLLETVIQDATIPVFSVTPRQLIEGSFGEPRWRYDGGDGEYKYDFAKRPDYFLEPDFEEREEYEPKAEGPKGGRRGPRGADRGRADARHRVRRLLPSTRAREAQGRPRLRRRGAPASPEVPVPRLQGRQAARRGSASRRRAAAGPEPNGADAHARRQR